MTARDSRMRAGHSRHPRMIILDIALGPSASGDWNVASEPHSVAFGSRKEALKFAAALARNHAHRGSIVLLNIEGADGQWRLFTHELKAPGGIRDE